MRLASPPLAHQDQIASLADELGAEVATEQLPAKRALEREVVFVDGLEEREVRVSGRALKSCLLSLRDLLAHEGDEEVTAGPSLRLSPLYQPLPAPAGICQGQPPGPGGPTDGLRVG